MFFQNPIPKNMVPRREKVDLQHCSGNLVFAFTVIRQAQIFSCACLKHIDF